jgi:type IV pilus assembly protein PilW
MDYAEKSALISSALPGFKNAPEDQRIMKSSKNNGFTLIELLIAMAIASIVMAAVVSAYQLQVRGQNTQEALTDMNQSARAALEIMTTEIRSAGLNPLRVPGLAGILTAKDDQLNFTMDLGDGASFQADGDINDPNENITYQLFTDTDGNRDLGRNSGGLQALARNVDALNFVYLNGNSPQGVIPTPVSAANLSAIRSIQVTIVVRAGAQAGGFLHPYTNTTTYKNLQGEDVYTAPGDSFRRIALTTTINCLNLGIGS